MQVGLRKNDTALPQMIAFAPSVELLFSKRDRVHITFLQSIATAALLSGRVPVFPLVPCDSPWLAHREASHVVRRSTEVSNMVDRFVVPFGPPDDLRCFWKAWACKRCHKAAMPWYKFEEVLRHAPRHTRQPSEGVPPHCTRT